MLTLPAATAFSDLEHSASATPSTSAAATSPNPTTAAVAIHANSSSGYDIKNNPRSDSSIAQLSDSEMKEMVYALYDNQRRRDALDILSKVINSRPVRTAELAPMLWNTPGIAFILLKEALTAYRFLNNEDRLKLISGRVLNAICLLQCVAMHASCRRPFVTAHIPIYLYPFLRMKETTPTTEKLRLASLGTLGALVKMNDPQVIHYLLDSQVFPCCLCSLEFGDQLAKSVAAYVMYKLLSSEFGINYCCNFSERFLSVVQVLRKIIEQTSELNEHTIRMLRFALGSYLVLAEFPRACEYLKLYFPSKFCSAYFVTLLQKVEPRLYEDLMRLCDKIDAEMIRLRLPTLGPLRL
uniref:Cell differentiation protein rcd1 n=1 Tax=Kalanchoe fedtschenkoi TaxID=63787 RepID=A0A7N0ZT38_KALFE